MNGEAIRIPVAPKFASEATNNSSACQLTPKTFAIRFSVNARTAALYPRQ
jgi:hypothetical protein